VNAGFQLSAASFVFSREEIIVNASMIVSGVFRLRRDVSQRTAPTIQKAGQSSIRPLFSELNLYLVTRWRAIFPIAKIIHSNQDTGQQKRIRTMVI
jgi:hypothetical protein